MRTYSLPEGLWLSFVSKHFYQSVAAHWRARAIIYLFLVLLVSSVPGAIRFTRTFHSGVALLKQNLIGRIPPIEITKGQVHTPLPIPYEIRLGTRPQDSILIDTSGKTTSLNGTLALVLVTKDKVFVRKSADATREYDLSGVNDLHIDEARLFHWLDLFDRWFPWLLTPLLFFFTYLKRLTEALLLAMLGVLLVRWFEASLTFGQLLALAIVALTPTIVWVGVVDVIGHPVRFQMLTSAWLTFGYYFYALNAATDFPPEGMEP